MGPKSPSTFSRAFIIEIDDLRNQQHVIDILTAMENEGIHNIRHDTELVDIILSISNAVRAACVVFILLLAFVAVIIIYNTIQITVNARKDAISIMKYVGAKDSFIRWPFIIEGILIGLLGGIIPVVFCWFGYNRVIEMVTENFRFLSFIEFRQGYEIFAYLFPFSLFLGIMIGMIGSALSIRRYLKV